MNPDPRLLVPDDAARHMDVIRFDHQREMFGNADRGTHLEGGAGFGEIANGAVDSAAAKRNPARLQQAPPWCRSVLVHRMDLHLNGKVSHGRGYYPVTEHPGSHTTKGGGCPPDRPITLSRLAIRPRPPPLDRVGGVVEPRRRGVAADYQAVDERLVFRREAIVERLHVIVPLLLRAGARDHAADKGRIQYP